MNSEQAVIFLQHIREHAVRYFPGFVAREIDVRLIGKQKRPSAIFYRFRVKDKVHSRSIIVKVPLRNSAENGVHGPVYEKPLLFPKAKSTEMHSLQHTALVTIYEYFTSLNRKQFGAIRVLDHLPQFQAILMEESRDPKLRQLLLRESRLRSSFARRQLAPAFRNAGAWLRLYHTMPKKEQVQVRDQHRDDYIDAVSKLTNFLANVSGYKHFFDQIGPIIINMGREILPESLPLGLGHGDYALRNILIGPNGRVTVLDTFAKWRTPIYEDIGYFLCALKMTSPQVISQGLLFSRHQLNEYEDAFLKGYFEQKPIPYPRIRLYEMLALLDKWSTVVTSCYRQTGKLKMVGKGKAVLTSLYFKRRTAHLLQEITGVKKVATSMDTETSH